MHLNSHMTLVFLAWIKKHRITVSDTYWKQSIFQTIFYGLEDANKSLAKVAPFEALIFIIICKKFKKTWRVKFWNIGTKIFMDKVPTTVESAKNTICV